MRLIDADVLIKNLLKEAAHQAIINHPENARGLKYAAERMGELPTAYDVDKVVEQLEESSFASEICEEFKPGWFKNREIEALELKEVIEIVKGAVKDE